MAIMQRIFISITVLIRNPSISPQGLRLTLTELLSVASTTLLHMQKSILASRLADLNSGALVA